MQPNYKHFSAEDDFFTDCLKFSSFCCFISAVFEMYKYLANNTNPMLIRSSCGSESEK